MSAPAMNEIAEIYRVALTWTDDRAKARRLVECWLAGQAKAAPR